MDFLRELLKIKEGFSPDFESMTDRQLMDLCSELEMEDACELDDDGKIINRDRLIRDLAAGHGGGDMDVPMEGIRQLTAKPSRKALQNFIDVVSEIFTDHNYHGMESEIPAALDEALRDAMDDGLTPQQMNAAFNLSVQHDEGWTVNDIRTFKRVFEKVTRTRYKTPQLGESVEAKNKPQCDVCKEKASTTQLSRGGKMVRACSDCMDEYGSVPATTKKVNRMLNVKESIPVMKFKQVATPAKPALPAHGGPQKDVANKSAKKAIEDEIGNKGMKGMKKKDRPYMEKPRFRDWLTANMFFNMTKSGELAGKMKLGEGSKTVTEGLWSDVKSSFSKGMKNVIKRKIPAEHHKHYDFDSIKTVGDANAVVVKAKKAGHIK